MDKENKNLQSTGSTTYESQLKEMKDFINEQSQCPVCNGQLDIYTEVTPSTYMIKEEARCVECMTLSRVENHHLH